MGNSSSIDGVYKCTTCTKRGSRFALDLSGTSEPLPCFAVKRFILFIDILVSWINESVRLGLLMSSFPLSAGTVSVGSASEIVMEGGTGNGTWGALARDKGTGLTDFCFFICRGVTVVARREVSGEVEELASNVVLVGLGDLTLAVSLENRDSLDTVGWGLAITAGVSVMMNGTPFTVLICGTHPTFESASGRFPGSKRALEKGFNVPVSMSMSDLLNIELLFSDKIFSGIGEAQRSEEELESGPELSDPFRLRNQLLNFHPATPVVANEWAMIIRCCLQTLTENDDAENDNDACQRLDRVWRWIDDRNA